MRPSPVLPLLCLYTALVFATTSEGAFADTPAVYRGLDLLKDKRRSNPDPERPRPIAAHKTLFTDEMTWLEVRDAIRAGKTTVILATGGIEMNGPYLVTGKHNVVLRVMTRKIAEKLGNALIAPIVKFVPEGGFEPPSGHMRYPGSIGVSQATFEALLTDIANSLRINGFTDIVLIGDSGGNKTGMEKVTAKLSKTWPKNARIHYVPDYAGYDIAINYLEREENIVEASEQIHDTYRDTALMMLYDPTTVRMQQRIAAGRFSINGFDLQPVEKTLAVGERLADYLAERTVAAVKKSMRAKTGGLNPP